MNSQQDDDGNSARGLGSHAVQPYLRACVCLCVYVCACLHKLSKPSHTLSSYHPVTPASFIELGQQRGAVCSSLSGESAECGKC